MRIGGGRVGGLHARKKQLDDASGSNQLTPYTILAISPVTSRSNLAVHGRLFCSSHRLVNIKHLLEPCESTQPVAKADSPLSRGIDSYILKDS